MDIQPLLDERAIREGLARFARILDERDWSSIRDVFASDVSFFYGEGSGGEQTGVVALKANFRRFLDRCGPSQHLIGSIAIEIEGDRAVSRSYVQARHLGTGARAQQHFDTNGEYTDGWERRPEGWRIVRRDARWFMQVGDPAVLFDQG